MREWKEVGGLLLTDSSVCLLMRASEYGQSGASLRSIDILLKPDEIYELYTVLKSKLESIMNEKACSACKHYGYLSCGHPGGEEAEYECQRKQKKYFEPRFQL
jgi:hypothetical protein